MNKKTIKIILIISMIICIGFIITSPVLATLSGDQIKADANAWRDKGQQNNPISVSKISEIIKPIANILMAIGCVVIVAMGIVIGIKYVTSSPDSKGKLKTQLFGLFVSGVVLCGAYGIWAIVYNILKELTA